MTSLLRRLAAALPLLAPAALAAQQVVIPIGPPPRQVERARAPLSESGRLWASVCRDDSGWNDPGPPMRLHGNVYYVGTCGISALLVTGEDGHVLIDGGTATGASAVLANIRELGFDPRDVKIILLSHDHHDHAGALARLVAETGARFHASAGAARVMASGKPDPADPQAADLAPLAPVTATRILADGDEVRVGRDIRILAYATPGHNAGAMSYSFTGCGDGACRAFVYADSLSPIAAGGWRFSDHPAWVAAHRASLARIAALDCEVLVTPHPSASGLRTRVMKGAALLDPAGCRAFAARQNEAIDKKLKEETR